MPDPAIVLVQIQRRYQPFRLTLLEHHDEYSDDNAFEQRSVCQQTEIFVESELQVAGETSTLVVGEFRD